MIPVIVFDGQLFQTSAWYRGMGKFMFNMVVELKRFSSEYEFVLVLNINLNIDNERVSVIRSACPFLNIIEADLPLPRDKRYNQKDYQKRLSTILGDNLPNKNIHYVITSLFLFDFYSDYPDNVKKLLIFYDLTPLFFWKDLGGYFPQNIYMPRFTKILEADKIFSISGTIKDDLIRTFGLDEHKIVNINGGFDKNSYKAKKPSTLEIPERYILLPTGDLPHKNNEVAIKGFVHFNRRFAEGFSLIVTSEFTKRSQDYLSQYSDKIIFSGNIVDEELAWLYKHTEAVLFSSKYEGLGIPILDAVAAKKPVVASKIPIFLEITNKDFYFFDVDSDTGVSDALELALSDDNFEEKRKRYENIISKYAWENTSSKFVEGIGSVKSQTKKQIPKNNDKIAVVSINPGFNCFTARLVEPLSHVFIKNNLRVDYFFDGYSSVHEFERPTFMDYVNLKIFDISQLTKKRARRYDTVIYIVDNSCIASQLPYYLAGLPGGCIELSNYNNFISTREEREVYQHLLKKQALIHVPESNLDHSSLINDIIRWVQGVKNG